MVINKIKIVNIPAPGPKWSIEKPEATNKKMNPVHRDNFGFCRKTVSRPNTGTSQILPEVAYQR